MIVSWGRFVIHRICLEFIPCLVQKSLDIHLWAQMKQNYQVYSCFWNCNTFLAWKISWSDIVLCLLDHIVRLILHLCNQLWQCLLGVDITGKIGSRLVLVFSNGYTKGRKTLWTTVFHWTFLLFCNCKLLRQNLVCSESLDLK